jgi:serine/threonine protein kinase
VQVLHEHHRVLNWDVILSMLLDTAKGVSYLHGSEPQIIHRDLKSHNVLINEHWVAKVCDFGLSRLAVESHTMTACGTPCWTVRTSCVIVFSLRIFVFHTNFCVGTRSVEKRTIYN